MGGRRAPLPLRERFDNAGDALLAYYERNKVAREGRRTLLYPNFGAGLRSVTGAYFSEVDDDLAAILFGESFAPAPIPGRPPPVSTRTGEAVRTMRQRLGQSAFAENVLSNYGGACCFPGCDVCERTFLIGSHIARWADDPGRRGETANGLCCDSALNTEATDEQSTDGNGLLPRGDGGGDGRGEGPLAC
jgi:hypothetical protein